MPRFSRCTYSIGMSMQCVATQSAIRAPVRSVEPSSMMISSFAGYGSSSTLSRQRRTKRSWLYAGISTETSGGAVPLDTSDAIVTALPGNAARPAR